MLDKYKEFRHEWEQPFLEMTRDFIFPNTFATIEYALKNLGRKHGTKFEFEVTRIRGIVENPGLRIATPDEARERPALKGGDVVGF